MERFIFIYAKDGKIKALTHSQALEKENKLKDDAWSHTATLDVTTFLQYLHNDCEKEDLLNEVKSLSTSSLQGRVVIPAEL
jgi:hypothetical protein